MRIGHLGEQKQHAKKKRNKNYPDKEDQEPEDN